MVSLTKRCHRTQDEFSSPIKIHVLNQCQDSYLCHFPTRKVTVAQKVTVAHILTSPIPLEVHLD